MKKIKLFGKKPKYLDLLTKYNTLVIKYEALQETVKSDLYKNLFEQFVKDNDKLESYELEIKRLRAKNKELKAKINEIEK